MRFWRHLTGAIAGVSAGALYGWSALAAPLQQAYQVRAAEVGQVFSFALLSFTLAVVVAPMLRRRLGSCYAMATLFSQCWPTLSPSLGHEMVTCLSQRFCLSRSAQRVGRNLSGL